MEASNEFELALLDRVLERTPVPASLACTSTVDQDDRTERGHPWNLPGILAETRVTTNFGQVPAHLIRINDRLKTRDGRYLPVVRVSSFKLDEEFIGQNPNARPVKIPKDTLQRRFPVQDVYLSPGQLVAIASDSAQEQLTQAYKVASGQLAFDRSLGMIAYFEFILPEPAQICVEGLWTPAGLDQPAYEEDEG